VRLMHENHRPPAQRSALWLNRWAAGLNRTLDRLEQLHSVPPSLDSAPLSLDSVPPPLDLGAIATAIALTYLDFRLPEIDWRGRPLLEAAQSSLELRDSFKATHPRP
jgi:glutathione S-transferase